MEQKILNEVEVSKLINLALPTLRNWRHLRRGPKYLKMGKSVRYFESDVIEYVNSRRVSPENNG